MKGRGINARGQLVKLIAFALVALALLWVLWGTLLNLVTGDTHRYVATFTDVSGLHEGDNVRIAGVRVGRVDAVRLVDTHAEVAISVQADQPVFENTRVLIRYQNLVGLRYLALEPGAGPARPLPDGARIPSSRTEPSFDLSALFNGFAPLFAVLQPADLNRLAENIVQVLQGSGPEVEPLLRQTAELTNNIADRDKVIGSVITNLNAVLDQLATKGPQTDELLAQGRRLVDGLNANTEVIFGSLQRVREFTGNARDLVADIRPDLRTAIDNGVDATSVFARHTDGLNRTLAEFPRFLGGVGRVFQYGSWINAYLCAATLQLPGAPPGGFGTQPSDTHSEVCRYD